ncbi:Cytochrome P450 4C1 [Blattella germanica]|nr:Cytochrome P450 4C1 [Blattella germanica]
MTTPEMRMEPITILLSSALFIVSFLFLFRQGLKRARFVYLVNKLPGPPAYPIIGNVLEVLVPRNKLFEVFDRRAKDYGPLFRIWAGPVAQICLTRPEHVEVMRMEPITILLSSALFIVSFLFLFRQGLKRARFVYLVNKLPGPPAYPIIGNVLEVLVPRNKLFEVFDRRAKDYGPLFRIWAGPVAQICLTRPEHVEIILRDTKHLDKSLAYSFIRPWLGEGLLTGTGAKWHSHRKMITPTFHFKILDIFTDVFVEKSDILVKKLQAKVGEKDFDIYPFITHCALDIICETAMGIQMNAQEESESDYVRAVYEISELTMQRSVRPWMHPKAIFDMTSKGKRYADCLSVLHGFTNKVIQERKILRQNGESIQTISNDEDELIGTKKRLAFLDLLLEASEKGTVKLTDTDIREEVDTFMFEGHDTTSAGICWALFLLGSHPEIQELDRIFQGTDRPITTRDLNEMKYLERVIKESLRLFPSVPFIGRVLKEDTKIGDYLVPAGCMMNLQIYHVHRNPDQYPEPEKFNPDNFLPERVAKRHPYAYVPFSAGPRNCIGQKFALLEEKTVLSSILRNFKVTSMELRKDLTLMNELILRPETGIRLKLSPRIDSAC